LEDLVAGVLFLARLDLSCEVVFLLGRRDPAVDGPVSLVSSTIGWGGRGGSWGAELLDWWLGSSNAVEIISVVSSRRLFELDVPLSGPLSESAIGDGESVFDVLWT
jgi:hypothetical protein